MAPTGAADTAAHSLAAGQRRHRDAAAPAWRGRRYDDEGHVHGAAHRGEGGPGRGN